MSTLTYTANECSDEPNKFCADISPGQDRLLDCIEKNGTRVSGRKQAFRDVGGSMK